MAVLSYYFPFKNVIFFLFHLRIKENAPDCHHTPAICRSAGTSLNRKSAKTAAATGSHSLEADTKEGEKNFRHQLKILCPKRVEHTLRSRPTTTDLTPYPVKARPLKAVASPRARAQNT